MSGTNTRIAKVRAPPARLSCEFCQRRKIRCDKKVPCGTCERAGRQCEVIERARLARGRSVVKNKSETPAHAARASTPEGLVSVLAVEGPSIQSSSTSPIIRSGKGPRDELLALDIPGTSFWSTLRTQVCTIIDHERQTSSASSHVI